MKFVTLIALGTLVFLSSEGRALDNDSFSESQGSCSPTLPLKFDTTDTPSLGPQSVSLGSPFDDLILRGRVGGLSPQGDHFGDLLRTTPRVPSGDSRLKDTRGQTFYIPQINNSKEK